MRENRSLWQPALVRIRRSPGVSGTGIRNIGLFVYILPFIEQEPLRNRFDFTIPSTPLTPAEANSLIVLRNSQDASGNYTQNAPAATIVTVFLCPSDVIPANPLENAQSVGPSRWFALTSYGGNGGTSSLPPAENSADGVFFQAAPGRAPVRLTDVPDGTSNTLFFGERSHVDPNYQSFVENGFVNLGPGINTMAMWGWWAPSTGGFSISNRALSCANDPRMRINYRIPWSFANRPASIATPTDFREYVPASSGLRQRAYRRRQFRICRWLRPVPDRTGFPHPSKALSAQRWRGDRWVGVLT